MRAVNRPGFPIASSLAALACLALWFAFGESAAWLAFDRQAILAGQVWRLWSGHLVHYSLHHALLDGSVLFLLGMVAERELGTCRIGLALFLGAPVISLGLLLAAPEMAYYRGASGLATLAAVAGGTALWHSSPKLKALLFACGAFMAIKVALESLGQPLDMANLPENVQVAWQAHLLGGLLGFVAGTCLKSDSQEAENRNTGKLIPGSGEMMGVK